jgi:hypothetical protein
VGRMIHSSTLLIPYPWGCCMAKVPLLTLSSKSCFLAHTGTQSSTLSATTQLATFTLRCQGNQCSCCSMGSRRHKPAGTVPLAVATLSCALWSP